MKAAEGKIGPALITTTVMLSLLNPALFGSPGLFSYFGFMVPALLFFLYMTCQAAMGSVIAIVKPPKYSYICFILSCYVAIHGLVTGTFGLTNYYWIVAFFWLIGIQLYLSDQARGQSVRKAILWIALIESLIILLQSTGWLPSMNDRFSCTGTCENPNITAFFLAMSLYPLFSWRTRILPRSLYILIMLPVLTAIILLRSRSAYLAAMIIIFEIYGKHLYRQLAKRGVRSSRPVWVSAVIIVSGLIVYMLVFHFKYNSAAARWHIWSKSGCLILQHPIGGNGFGRFEHSYNLFIAEHPSQDNDHVNMPYNDFMEITIEGGLPSLLLWIMFYFYLILSCYRRGYGLSPVLAFLVIETTNFGFQAIPAFSLFLLIIGSLPGESDPVGKPIRKSARIMATILGLIAFWLLTWQSILAFGFWKQHELAKAKVKRESIVQFQSLRFAMEPYALFHYHYGNAFFQMGLYQSALAEYQHALLSCSKPEVLEREAESYKKLKRISEAVSCYRELEHMQPYRLNPNWMLLNIYAESKDSASVEEQARIILGKPIKIPGREANLIKQKTADTLTVYSSSR